MRLGAKQRVFARNLGRLLVEIYGRANYAATMGAAQRSIEEAIRRGKRDSCHVFKLAADLNLFKRKNGRWVYLTSTKAHRPFGRFWQELTGYYDPKTLRRYSTTEGKPGDFLEFCWGGVWKDGNHYSIRHRGIM